jgi:tetratricopeptide (TPR) repeat protein
MLCGLALLLLSGCAELPPQPALTDGDLAWVLAGADLPMVPAEDAIEDPAAVMRLSEEMRRFAENATLHAHDPASKTKALVNAMAAESGLHLQYDAEATLTAEQAFQQHRANCLSYTLLFIALAREVNLTANFNDVDIPPIWGMGDATLSLLYGHINAGVELDLGMYQIVDVSSSEYDPNYAQSVISDDEALAQFYNNRAVELRLQKQPMEALRYELRALQLAPRTDYLWTNLANLYLQEGNGRAARIAVSRALALDGSGMLSYMTAERVYRQLGDRQLSGYFHQRAAYFLEQNPYRHYQLAVGALSRKDYELAYNESYKAIKLYGKDARFYFLMAAVLDHLGQVGPALESMQAAIDLTPDPAQQDRYRSKFERLANSG